MQQPDYVASKPNNYRGLLQFINLENYSDRMTYLFTDSQSSLYAFPSLAPLSNKHAAVRQAEEDWGLNLTSGYQVEAIGVTLVIQQKPIIAADSQAYYLRFFAIVQNKANYDYDIRFHQQVFLSQTGAISTPFWDAPAIKYANGKLCVVTSDKALNGPAQKSFIMSSVETKSPTFNTIDFGGYNGL